MTPHALKRLDRELTTFVETLTAGLGRSERRTAMGQYITGLLLDGERKSIEPIAARLVEDEAQIEAMRQRLQQCVVVSTWDEATVFTRVAQLLDRELPEVTAFVVDDTGFPKKGRHSVGVARQYSGTLGRTDNCQIATSLHLAGERGSGCIGMRLYLPESWTNERDRCRAAGVPDRVTFAPKWQHALALLDAALAAGVRRHVVLGDAAFGEVTAFREALTTRGLSYVLRVPHNLVAWPPGTRFVVPTRRGPTGRPRSTPPSNDRDLAAVARHHCGHAAASARDLAGRLAWSAGVAFRGGAGASRASSRGRRRPGSGGVVAERVAAGRDGADEVLPLVVTRDDAPAHVGPIRKIALADRTRLSRAERRARARSLRGTHVDGISSPRRLMCGGPRVPRAPSGAFPPGAVRDGRSPPCAVTSKPCCCCACHAARSADSRRAIRINRAARRACDQVVLSR